MKRIKRALANFLRDELLELIGYSKQYDGVFQSTPREVIYGLNVMKMEAKIDMDSINTRENYEGLLYDAKRNLAEKVMEQMEVETFPLVDRQFMNCRQIVISIKVAERK